MLLCAAYVRATNSPSQALASQLRVPESTCVRSTRFSNRLRIPLATSFRSSLFSRSLSAPISAGMVQGTRSSGIHTMAQATSCRMWPDGRVDFAVGYAESEQVESCLPKGHSASVFPQVAQHSPNANI
jgi:hypothetical protein